jgi:hypothetical protein
MARICEKYREKVSAREREGNEGKIWVLFA